MAVALILFVEAVDVCSCLSRSYTGDEVQENKDSPFGAQSVARHCVKLRRIADH